MVLSKFLDTLDSTQRLLGSLVEDPWLRGREFREKSRVHPGAPTLAVCCPEGL